MQHLVRIVVICGLAIGLSLVGCKEYGSAGSDTTASHGHDHGDGTDPAHGTGGGDPGTGADHHDEVPLGTAMVGDLKIECAQGHGETAAGKEMHLVVKLPYSDDGATIVRAWIGTEDRLGSMVAKADYAASHDDYDVHAEAPNPLPAGAKWWIEVERPGGDKSVGSIALR